MTPSKYQVEIYKQYQETNDNLIIQAGPGTGKSHTILEMLKLTPKFKKTILTAFNKSISEELQSKVPVNVKVSTIHALGFSILRQNWSRNYKVTSYKNFIIGKQILHKSLQNMKEKDRNIYLFILSEIIDLIKLNLIKTKEEQILICDEYNISITNGELEDVDKILTELNKYNLREYNKEFMIDFVDMLYLPYQQVSTDLFPKYQVVFTDELQDLNPLQKYIIENIISEKGGRFVGVGDERQAIYSFMGANLKSFQSFKDRPNTQVLPLSVTYRCSKKVTEFANTIFDGLEPFENNIEGIVRDGNLSEAENGDFVLCRNNLPLIEAWIQLVKEGKKCSILGKEYGEQLISIMNKLSNYPDYKEGVDTILKKKEEELIKSGVEKPTSSANYQKLVEKLNIVEILKKEFGSFQTAKERVEEIFNETGTGIRLMTIHKSKGLESKRVFVIGYKELLPSKYAKSMTEIYQEHCLKYVCVTRAKNELVFVNL